MWPRPSLLGCPRKTRFTSILLIRNAAVCPVAQHGPQKPVNNNTGRNDLKWSAYTLQPLSMYRTPFHWMHPHVGKAPWSWIPHCGVSPRFASLWRNSHRAFRPGALTLENSGCRAIASHRCRQRCSHQVCCLGRGLSF